MAPRSILMLDKSEESAATKLETAAEILDLDLDCIRHSSTETRSKAPFAPPAADPRFEYALKWLLKRSQGPGSKPNIMHLNYQGWNLFQLLVPRIPPSRVAHLLKEFSFTKTLKDTLQQLRDQITQEQAASRGPSGGSDSGSLDLKVAADGSKTAKKKKLDGTEISPDVPFGTVHVAEKDKILVSICEILGQLETLSSNNDHHGYAAERIRAALKSAPEEAAGILGNAMYSMNHFLQMPKRQGHSSPTDSTSHPEESLMNTSIEPCLFSLNDFWNHQLQASQGGTTMESIHKAFIAHTMLPCLHLLLTFQKPYSLQSNLDALKTVLEELLIKHIILPFRASLGSPSTETRKDKSLADFPDVLAESFKNFVFYQPKRSSSKSKAYLEVSCLSLLFKVAVCSRPRATLKLRRTEDAWLGAFLIQIRQCASAVLDPSSSTFAHKDFARLTKWTLETAVEKEVSLSSVCLKQILEDVSCLLDNEDKKHVEWDIVSLCLVMNANVFVNPSMEGRNEAADSCKQRNKYLLALLSKVSKQSCEMDSDSDGDYAFQLSHVLTPLLNAFAEARDFLGFIDHWREQLTSIQRRRRVSGLPNHLTIWEDDVVLRAASSLCESTLTAGQAKTLLHSAVQAFESPRTSSDDSFCSLIIIDVVIRGCHTAEFITRMAETAGNVVQAIAQTLKTRSHFFENHEWRAWRIMATFNERWRFSYNVHGSSDSGFPLATKARELLCPKALESIQGDMAGCSARLQAFALLLSFVSANASSISDGSLSETISQGIENVLLIKEEICGQLGRDLFEMSKPQRKSSTWNLRPHAVKSIDELYIGCVSQLLLSKNALDFISIQTLERLFNQLYLLASNQSKSTKSRAGTHIDYAWLWQMLLNVGALDENVPLKVKLQDLRATQYIALLNSADPRCWDIKTTQYALALDSLQRISISTLASGHRAQIANIILRILLYQPLSNQRDLTAYLDLLTRLIEHPSQSMDLLSKLYGVTDGTVVKGKMIRINSIHEPALIALADKIGAGSWSVDVAEAVSALQRLCKRVMRYLLSMMTHNTSVEYIKAFHGWLHQTLADNEALAQLTVSKSVVVEVVLQSSPQFFDKAPESFKEEATALDKMRQRHLDSLIEKLEAVREGLDNLEHRHICGTVLESLVSYDDLLCMHPDFPNISASFKNLAKIGGNFDDTVQGTKQGLLSNDYLQARLARLELALGRRDYHLHPCFAETTKVFQIMHNSKEKDNLLRYFQENVALLEEGPKIRLLSDLTHDDLDEAKLRVLQRVVVCCQGQQSEVLQASLSRIFMIVNDTMVKPTTFQTSLLSMQYLSMLLQNHPHLIRQWHIDSLFAAITAKSISLSSQRESKHSTMLYIGLCRLFGTILTLHRAKTGGRYHILVPALQALLRCLFHPYISGPESTSAFTSVHASAFTRILTSVCDPAVSAVTRSKKRPRLELNDETKKARSIAGQHMPYLVMEYCVCQLKGRLRPEMKTALEPGLFAVINVMTQERMRTLNAALDESARAVWKALYEDWRRFGR